MPKITISTEEIDAWVRDIQLFRAHLGHAKDAEPVLPSGTEAAEMRERLFKLRSVLDAMGSRGAITITSSCSPPVLKQEHPDSNIVNKYKIVLLDIKEENEVELQEGDIPILYYEHLTVLRPIRSPPHPIMVISPEPKKESEIRMIPALCPGCNKPIEICTGQFRLCVNRDHVKYPDPIWDPVKLRWADTPDEIEELRRSWGMNK